VGGGVAGSVWLFYLRREWQRRELPDGKSLCFVYCAPQYVHINSLRHRFLAGNTAKSFRLALAKQRRERTGKLTTHGVGAFLRSVPLC